MERFKNEMMCCVQGRLSVSCPSRPIWPRGRKPRLGARNTHLEARKTRCGARTTQAPPPASGRGKFASVRGKFVQGGCPPRVSPLRGNLFRRIFRRIFVEFPSKIFSVRGFPRRKSSRGANFSSNCSAHFRRKFFRPRFSSAQILAGREFSV